MAERRGSVTLILFQLLPVLVIVAFFLAPLGVMVTYSFWTNHGISVGPPWTVNNYTRFFDSPVYLNLMLKSLRISGLMVVLAILLAFPLAYIIARVVPARWRLLVIAAIMIPSMTSFLIRTYAWIIILNENGMVNATLLRIGLIEQPLPLLYNQFAVFVGLLYVYIPWMILPIYASLHKIDPSLYEAAADLGASRFQIWRRIVIPLSMPGIVAAAFLGFIPSIGTYATPMLLGGRTGLMYANLITSQFSAANNWPFGAALAIVLLLVVLVAIAIYYRLGKMERLWES